MLRPPQMSERCTVCLSTALQHVLKKEGYRLDRCRSCGHLFVADAIAPRVLQDAYDESFYVNASSDTAPKGYRDYLATLEKRLGGFRRWFRTLEKIVGKPGRALDFGCAVGVMVKAAQDTGWNAIGFERSQWASDYGRKHFGVEIVTGDGASDPFPPDSFDLVTLWDVVEHLESPRDVLTMVHRWLRRGGWIAINTVDSGGLGARLAGEQWRHLRPPVHLQYFTRESLAYLLADRGFKVQQTMGNGVFLSARTGGPLGPFLQVLENSATHWRSRKLVDTLGLLDEVQMLATKL
jgi:2-polyprenyl-3-methyl-5-hydroxy-6-metoxy-1,4-benzoquinol methylase